MRSREVVFRALRTKLEFGMLVVVVDIRKTLREANQKNLRRFNEANQAFDERRISIEAFGAEMAALMTEYGQISAQWLAIDPRGLVGRE